MDLEDRVSFIKMRIHKFKKTYTLNTDPNLKPSKPLFEDKYDNESNSKESGKKLEHLREIKETEALLRKELAQLRMARYTLIAMGLFTAVMFLPWIPLERVEAMGNVSSLFYISGAGIVGAYMGVSAWMSKRG